MLFVSVVLVSVVGEMRKKSKLMRSEKEFGMKKRKEEESEVE